MFSHYNIITTTGSPQAGLTGGFNSRFRPQLVAFAWCAGNSII